MKVKFKAFDSPRFMLLLLLLMDGRITQTLLTLPDSRITTKNSYKRRTLRYCDPHHLTSEHSTRRSQLSFSRLRQLRAQPANQAVQ